MKTVHLSVFSHGKKTKFLCDHRNNDNRHTKVSKNQQTTQATMAQSGARKSHNLKVVSSSLTGRSSRRIILLALYPTLHFYKKKEKLLTKSIASRTEINFVRLIKSIYKKKSDCTAVAQKEGDKCKRCSHENSSFECF